MTTIGTERCMPVLESGLALKVRTLRLNRVVTHHDIGEQQDVRFSCLLKFCYLTLEGVANR